MAPARARDALAMIAFEVLFVLSVVFVFYAYLGYALILYAISFVRSRQVRTDDHTPTVAFIITVHNEEARIREKLENTLRLLYPAERLDVVVASDCSTDRTHEIVGEYAAQGVRLVVARSAAEKSSHRRPQSMPRQERCSCLPTLPRASILAGCGPFSAPSPIRRLGA